MRAAHARCFFEKSFDIPQPLREQEAIPPFEGGGGGTKRCTEGGTERCTGTSLQVKYIEISSVFSAADAPSSPRRGAPDVAEQSTAFARRTKGAQVGFFQEREEK